MLLFNKRLIANEAYEACSVFDVNGDGVPDIVSGAFWYEGPDYERRHRICEIEALHGYHDDFSDFPMDIDGDGWPDIVTGAWWGETLRWRRNPGPGGGEWKTFDIDRCGAIETIRFFDIDGCGMPEIFPNTPFGPQVFYKLLRDSEGRSTGDFRKVVIGDAPSGHGLGFADVTGNGRMDIILSGGWLEQPDDPYEGPWVLHSEFQLGSASVPIIGCDVTGNGLTDLIVGQAHDYGLHWYEQLLSPDGTRNWRKHTIDDTGSQFHDLQLVDLDLDGQPELVTGKRYRAHNDDDPGAHDPIGLYYYKINGGQFTKHIIDYGEAGEASGAGIYFWVQDLTGNGYPDIVAPGKDGLFLFENLGPVGEEKQ